VATDSPGERIFVGIGSNLDDPRAQVLRAFDELAAIERTRLLRRSPLYRTPPWGFADQPPYVNAVAELASDLDPRALLSHLLAIERSHGRHRDGERWGPRTLDLDLLLHGDARIDEPGLVVPHPRASERAFVLVPLAELDPGLVIAGAGPVQGLLARLGPHGCERID